MNETSNIKPDDNDENTEATAAEDAADEQPSSSHRAAWLAALFLLIALAAAASAGYLWLELREFRAARAWNSEQVRRLEASFNELHANVIPRAPLEQRLSTNDTARQRLQTRLRALEKSTDRLRQLAEGSREVRLRIQVVSLLQMAHDELTLAGNIDAALAALQAADARLKAWPGSELQAVRANIRADIAALQALPDPDITGMALTLNALAAQVPGLPLQAEAQARYAAAPTQTTATDSGFWQRLWQGLTNTFSTMVSVRRTETPVKPLLTPNQEALVYQQLTLQLHTARLALLKGDYANYHASLVNAQTWLNRWFDTSHTASQAMLNDIARLLETPLPTKLPTLTATVTLMDNTGTSPANMEDKP